MTVCLIITICIVYIWDWVQFPNELLAKLFKTTPDKIDIPKPFGCSLCMSTWVTLIVLLAINWKLAPLCLAYGFITPYILSAISISDQLIRTVLMGVQHAISKVEHYI